MQKTNRDKSNHARRRLTVTTRHLLDALNATVKHYKPSEFSRFEDVGSPAVWNVSQSDLKKARSWAKRRLDAKRED